MLELASKTLFWIVIFYFAMAVTIYMTQRDMMYFPDTQKPDVTTSILNGVKEINVQTEDGLILTAWFVKPAENKPVLIWFHGNGLNHSNRQWRVEPFVKDGYGVLLASYRGYAGNGGKPSEEGLYKDATAFIQFLKKYNYPYVLYGESLGTGVAVKMANQFSTIYAPLGIVLEAPYTSTVDIGQNRFPYLPVKFLMKDRFESVNIIGQLNVPVMIMHGQKDNIIPYKYGRQLFEMATEPKFFHSFPDANHLNLYEFDAADKVLEFINVL